MTDSTWPAADSDAVPPTGVRRRRFPVRRVAGATAISAMALAGIVIGVSGLGTETTAATTATVQDAAGTDDATDDTTTTLPEGSLPSRGSGVMPTGPGGASSGLGGAVSSQEDSTAASEVESTGLVLIDTVLGYSEAEAAGTGMVLTSDGLILTNNHVIEGATEITVTIGTTGATYTASLVGTDATNDVALLQLEDASGLSTVTLDDDAVATGDAITAVGNASGGGVLMAADGAVTALESEVTTASSYSTAGETLDGMIEFEADVVSGDSGGALLDAEGEVIGMTTAASSGLATTVAYAVPIADALAIVAQIQAGDQSGTVEVGYPAFLGIGLASDSAFGSGGRPGVATTSTAGARVGYVYADTPAAAAGLASGDVITAVDGVAVASGDVLAASLAEYKPGDTVGLTWTDAAGMVQQADVTLIAGPA